MRNQRFGISAFICILLLMAVTAGAQLFIPPPDFTVSTGYSNLQTQKANNLFYDHSGAYLDADVAWTLPLVVPLQVGIGATTSGYWERESIDSLSNDNFYYPYDHQDSNVGLFEIEPRVGLRLGGPTGFFALPPIGAGLLIDSYAIDQSFNSDGNTYLSTRYHTGAAFEVRPAIEVGYRWGFVSAGVEGSYMYSCGDFGDLGHGAQEYRIGAFVTFSF
jgi:hypothetical protein